MKKVILSVAAIVAFTAVSFAQDAAIATASAVTAVAADDDKGGDKKKVEASALPDAVKATLASDKYKDWQVATAWHVTEKDGEHYVLEMKKGDEKTTLKMNKEGQVI